jgi:hypothetical protein
LSMLANCHLNREASGKPDGWSPLDFMPGAQGAEREPDQSSLSLQDWARAWEAGKLSEPTTEQEKSEIRNLNQRMMSTFARTKTGQIIQVPR